MLYLNVGANLPGKAGFCPWLFSPGKWGGRWRWGGRSSLSKSKSIIQHICFDIVRMRAGRGDGSSDPSGKLSTCEILGNYSLTQSFTPDINSSRLTVSACFFITCCQENIHLKKRWFEYSSLKNHKSLNILQIKISITYINSMVVTQSYSRYFSQVYEVLWYHQTYIYIGYMHILPHHVSNFYCLHSWQLNINL